MSSETAVDPRGMRFAAALTTLVLAAVVLTEDVWLLAAQAVVFAAGAFGGVRRSPYAVVFARLIRPQLGPPTETEDARPPQFAQLVGLVFATIALVGFIAGAEIVGLVATSFALVAAFVNAAFGLCLGCEVYLLGVRARARLRAPTDSPPHVSPAPNPSSSTTRSTTTTEVSA